MHGPPNIEIDLLICALEVAIIDIEWSQDCGVVDEAVDFWVFCGDLLALRWDS